ncbi:MAG: ABC transporter substrate-binding protein [Acetatifactor sp.]
MMKRWTFGILLAYMLSCFIGCGAKPDPVAEENPYGDEYVWLSRFYNLGEDYNESSLFDTFGMDIQEGELIYALRPFSLVKPIHKNTIELQTMEGTDIPIEPEQSAKEDAYSVGRAGFDREGRLHMVYQMIPRGSKLADAESDVSRFEYRIYGADKEPVQTLDVTEYFTINRETAAITKCCAGKEGGIICLIETARESRLIAVSGEGELVSDMDMSSANVFDLVPGEEGEVFLLLQKTGEKAPELARVNIRSSEIMKAYSGIPDDALRISGYDGESILLISKQKLYRFSIRKEQAAEILTWSDYSMDGEYVRFAKMTDEQNIYVSLSNDLNYVEMAHLAMVPKSEVKEKEKVVLATLNPDDMLQRKVNDYNKYHDKYEVELKQVRLDNNDFAGALKELNQLILSDDCPDLIVISDQLDMEGFAANGVFEDLSPYLEKSRRVKREDFAENVLQAYTRSGKLLCIPSSFSISEAVVGKQSLAGEGFGRDIRDFQELAERYPDSLLFERTNCRMELLQMGWKSFVDFASGKCRFDSREFMEYLEWVRTYPDGMDNTVHPLKRYQSGEILFRLTPIFGVDGYWINIPVFGEQVSLFPYPGSDSVFIWSDDTYAITANSRQKEGAWDFIESCIRHRNVSEYYSGFPVRKDMRKELFDLFMEKRYKTDEAGNILYDEATGEPVEESRGIRQFNNVDIPVYAMTKEQTDVLEAFLDQPLAAREIANNREKEMYLIFIEEVQPYLLGQKSAEDVAKIIQSRLQLYLDED